MEASNIKAMREALKQIHDRVNSLDEDCAVDPIDIRDIARAALASPPRNCDMPLVVDGPADNNADKAWLVFKRQNPDAYFDVSGLLRCIDWLLAPATDRQAEKGGEMTDYSNIGAVCFDCAQKAGFTLKEKALGVWVGECEICHQQKPCTDLHHDWKLPKTESEVK